MPRRAPPKKTPKDETLLRGDRTKAARVARGWTQKDLSEKSGLHVPLLSELERGSGRDIRISTLAALARALEVSADYLLGLSNDAKPRG